MSVLSLSLSPPLSVFESVSALVRAAIVVGCGLAAGTHHKETQKPYKYTEWRVERSKNIRRAQRRATEV